MARRIPDEDTRITIGGQNARGLSVGGSNRGGVRFSGGGGTPKYVGARAEVLRTPEGVLIRLSDYKGTTEEIIAEAIEDIITNPDGSLLFVLPDGRTILTDSLKGDPGPTDYELMDNKPIINSFTIEGSKLGEDYNLQDKMRRITEQEIDNIIFGG